MRSLLLCDLREPAPVVQVARHHGLGIEIQSFFEWLQQAAAFWQDLLAEATADIHIHLENMIEERPDLQLNLVERVADPRLGICLDVGHAHALSRMPVVDWVGALDKRLTYVHLHDNHGVADDHLPLGEGALPLPEVLTALEASAPDAIWAIEARAEPSLGWLKAHGFVRPEASATTGASGRLCSAPDVALQ